MLKYFSRLPPPRGSFIVQRQGILYSTVSLSRHRDPNGGWGSREPLWASACRRHRVPTIRVCAPLHFSEENTGNPRYKCAPSTLLDFSVSERKKDDPIFFIYKRCYQIEIGTCPLFIFLISKAHTVRHHTV